MKQLYIFSGLGADKRVFEKIDFGGNSVTFINWIMPLPNEEIEKYAKRLLAQIKTENPVLVGLSFGGMIAVEVARQISAEKIILIASVKTKTGIPLYYRIAGRLGLHRLLPVALMKHASPFSNWLFGIKGDKDKQLLKAILHDTDAGFLRWAIDKAVRWKNTKLLSGITHIHGTADRVLPCCLARPDVMIKGGGHFMTVNKANGLSMVLQKLLS